MKIILKIFLIIFIPLIFFLTYLSTIGIETERLNTQIKTKVKEINSDLDIELNEVKIILNPFNLRLNVKTIGPKIFTHNKTLDIENIKTDISIRSLIVNEFSLETLEISTKTVEIKDLLFFYRSIYQVPEIIVLERLLKIKGYLIVNLNLEFDSDGNLKENFNVYGFIKDTKFSIFNDYNIDKLNFSFDISKDNLIFSDIKFKLNSLDFKSEIVRAKKDKDQYLLTGSIDNSSILLDSRNISFLKKIFPSLLNVKEISFSANNKFSLNVDKKFKFKDIKVNSTIEVDEAKILNKYSLNEIFPHPSL